MNATVYEGRFDIDISLGTFLGDAATEPS